VDVIDYGDAIVCVEMLGVFYYIESLMIERCLYPKLTAHLLRSLWNPNSTDLPNSICIFTISNPFPWWTVFIPVGLTLPPIVAIPILCKLRSQTKSNVSSKTTPNKKQKKKNQQKLEIKIEKSVDDPTESHIDKKTETENGNKETSTNEKREEQNSKSSIHPKES
jgi:hypothetical protein